MQPARRTTTTSRDHSLNPICIQQYTNEFHATGNTLEGEVEPFLLRRGFLQRTPRGCVVTASAFAHLKVTPPEQKDDCDQGWLF